MATEHASRQTHREDIIVKSGMISVLVFTIAGPVIGLLVAFHGNPVVLVFPFTIIGAFILGAPAAALAGVVFSLLFVAIIKMFKPEYIWYGSGALIGGIAGLISAFIFQVSTKGAHAGAFYLLCIVAGAACGALRCILPIDPEE